LAELLVQVRVNGCHCHSSGSRMRRSEANVQHENNSTNSSVMSSGIGIISE
jgi:hypothetical protein